MSIRPRSLGSGLRAALSITGDCLLAAATLTLVVEARRHFDIPFTRALLPPEKFPLNLTHIAVWSVALIVAMALSGFYSSTASPRHRPTLFIALPVQLAFIAIIGILLEIQWPRSVFIAAPLLEAMALPAWRGVVLRAWPMRIPRTVLIGPHAELCAVTGLVRNDPNSRLTVDGFVSTDGAFDHELLLGTMDDDRARKAIAEADEVIDLGVDDGERRLQLLELRGPRGFLFVPQVREGIVGAARFGMIGGRLLTAVQMPGAYGAGAFVKRSFDLLFASLLLIASFPLQLVAVLALLVEGRGPVMLRQTRLGLDGYPFAMWKFRTMDDSHAADLSLAQDADHRVTPVGRWLRRYRLDELPQLYNVIAGDMSLVGPRPEIPELAEAINLYLSGFELRLTMRPGIAGLAQVSAEYDQTPETKLTYDLQYLCFWTPALDIRILVQALTVVLAGRGV